MRIHNESLKKQGRRFQLQLRFAIVPPILADDIYVAVKHILYIGFLISIASLNGPQKPLLSHLPNAS